MSARRRSTPRRRKGIAVVVAVAAAGAGAALAAAFGDGPKATRSERNPDIVIITVDTLRHDHVGAFGAEQVDTPHLDALVERGTQLTQATVPFPRTSPALASLLTGLWAHHHGSREVGDPFERGTTLAEVLDERGYETLGVSANPKAGAEEGFDRGFDELVDTERLEDQRARTVTDRALELLGASHPRQPMLLWAHYLDPHWPYTPPEHWEDQPAAPRCRELTRRWKEGELTMGQVVGNVNGQAERARADCLEMYGAEIAYTDAQIGRLLDGLRDAGRLADAIVVFTSDHGENLGEEGMYYEHGPSLHGASLRVPLSIAGPGVSEGAVDDGVARIEDVMPTLLEMLAVPHKRWPPMDGRSLAPRLGGRWGPTADAPSERVAVAESGSALHLPLYEFLVTGRVGDHYCINGERLSLCGPRGKKLHLYDHVADPWLDEPVDDEHPDAMTKLRETREHWGPEQGRRRAARTPRYKLVEYPTLEGRYRRALYDLRADSRERRDVIERHPEVAARLGRHLDRFTAGMSTYEPSSRDEDLLESLRALGYVE